MERYCEGGAGLVSREACQPPALSASEREMTRIFNTLTCHGPTPIRNRPSLLLTLAMNNEQVSRRLAIFAMNDLKPHVVACFKFMVDTGSLTSSNYTDLRSNLHRNLSEQFQANVELLPTYTKVPRVRTRTRNTNLWWWWWWGVGLLDMDTRTSLHARVTHTHTHTHTLTHSSTYTYTHDQ